MGNERAKPLIRKQYSFLGILKAIFSKIAGGKKVRDLHIPGFAGTVEFLSVAERCETGNSRGGNHITDPAGIVSAMKAQDMKGLGGAGYPMAVKLEAVLESGTPEPVLVINGVECDPGLIHDKWILENKRKELREISGILRSAFGLSEVYLAKKAGTPPMMIEGVMVADVPDTYPAGEENRLISWLFGVECRKGSYPAEKGIWVQNVQSILALHSILTSGRLHRYLTMTDLDRRHSVVVECDPGMRIGELSERVFGRSGSLHIGGGIMQGRHADATEALDDGVNLIAIGEPAEFEDGDCRHCGQCSMHCPAELPLEDMVAEIVKGRTNLEQERDGCHRCGACSYLCPAGKDVCSLIALS